MYAEHDDEDGYEVMRNLMSRFRNDKVYLTETSGETRLREKQEYEEMLLKPKHKPSRRNQMSDYDKMLLRKA